MGASPSNGNNRVFSCNQCGKEFFKLSKLTQHVKTHSPEVHYKYPCDICDKSFAREDKLKYHLIKGCPPELDQSLDSRDSGDDGSPSRIDVGENEIDDDEEGQEDEEEGKVSLPKSN